jgi:Domain of unknown function (DUF4260)
MLTKPALLLHHEGAVILFLSVFVYHQLHARWLLFAILFLAPDLFMLGYLANDRLLAFGLKYPTHFKDTHLQHV